MGLSSKGPGKTDNNPQARRAKIAVRQHVLEAIGRKAGVFDAFAGSGDMYSAVWKAADAATAVVRISLDLRIVAAIQHPAPYAVFGAVALAVRSLTDRGEHGGKAAAALRFAAGQVLKVHRSLSAAVTYRDHAAQVAASIRPEFRLDLGTDDVAAEALPFDREILRPSLHAARRGVGNWR